MSEVGVIRDEIDVECPGCHTKFKQRVKMTLPQSPPQILAVKGVPLKGKVRLVWYAVGVVSWLAFVAYAQFDAAISLLGAVGVVIVILAAPYRQATLESTTMHGLALVGILFGLGAAADAAGLGVLTMLVLFYGLLIVWAPLVILQLVLVVAHRTHLPRKRQ